MSSPEALPEAPLELRRRLFTSIGLLAVTERGTGNAIEQGYSGVPEELIPPFIWTRLGLYRAPADYTVFAADLSMTKPASLHRIGIVARTISADFRGVTDYAVTTELRGEQQGYTAVRTVKGTVQQLPPPAPPELDPQSLEYLAWSLRHMGIPSPVGQVPGDWPEAQLVVPEAEQLLELTAALRQSNAGE